jgi:DNA-binding MarR family transcriptional regulator
MERPARLRMDRDPILEAYHLWIDNGWEECAAGCTAVASFMRVNQVLTKRADAILAPIDLTFPRYELLVRLHFLGESTPLNLLGRHLQLHQTSVTSLVDKLEAQGLIKRVRHPTDRRSTIAQMTDAGRRLLHRAIDLLNAELFRDPGLSDSDLRTLVGLLMKLRVSWHDIENLDGWEPVLAEAPQELAD